MTEAEFEALYRQTLLAIEEAVEAIIEDHDADLDYETINDILSIEFADSSEVIVTKQGATQQLWVAAVSGGFHFDFDEGSEQWCSTIDKEALFKKLAEIFILQGNVEINFHRE